MKKVLRLVAGKLSAFLDKWGEDYNMTCVRDAYGAVRPREMPELPEDR